MDLELKGKTALITGGSKGIGLATARTMAAEGARVMICSRSADALGDAAGTIKRSVELRVAEMRRVEVGSAGEQASEGAIGIHKICAPRAHKA